MISGFIEKDYVSKADLAEMLGVSLRTLDRWEFDDIGPRRTKIGRLVLYEKAEVKMWLDGKKVYNKEELKARLDSKNAD